MSADAECMRPDPTYDPDADAAVVEAFAERADDVVVRIWGADWCKDCRATLPELAALLDAADLPEDAVRFHELDREKRGEGVDEYGVEYVPTVVVEDREGTELARFVESEPVPVGRYLADRLD